METRKQADNFNQDTNTMDTGHISSIVVITVLVIVIIVL